MCMYRHSTVYYFSFRVQGVGFQRDWGVWKLWGSENRVPKNCEIGFRIQDFGVRGLGFGAKFGHSGDFVEQAA